MPQVSCSKPDGTHWERRYLISENDIQLVRRNLAVIERNMIHTQETAGCYDNILAVLSKVKENF